MNLQIELIQNLKYENALINKLKLGVVTSLIRLGVKIVLNAGEKYSERKMDGRLGSHSKLC